MSHENDEDHLWDGACSCPDTCCNDPADFCTCPECDPVKCGLHPEVVG